MSKRFFSELEDTEAMSSMMSQPFPSTQTQRKRSKATPRRKKAVIKASKGLNQAVLKVINRHREVKQQAYSFASNLNAYTGTSWALLGVQALTPYSGWVAVVQGNGQGDRIGNRIETKSCKLRMQFNGNPYNATTNPTPQPQFIFGWIATVKNSTAQPSSLNTFVQTGDTSAALVGTVLDMTRPNNEDQYIIYRRFKIKVGYAVNTGTGAVAAAGNHANNDFKYSEEINMDLTKYMPKYVEYNDTTTIPTSKAVWLFMESVNADGTNQNAAYLPILVNCTIAYEFYDA